METAVSPVRAILRASQVAAPLLPQDPGTHQVLYYEYLKFKKTPHLFGCPGPFEAASPLRADDLHMALQKMTWELPQDADLLIYFMQKFHSTLRFSDLTKHPYLQPYPAPIGSGAIPRIAEAFSRQAGGFSEYFRERRIAHNTGLRNGHVVSMGAISLAASRVWIGAERLTVPAVTYEE